MKKVVWGVLGTAKIARQKVIPAMQRSAWCDVRAIASRSAESARSVADTLGIPRAHGSYEALIADAEIEAVYNALPNHLHVTWTLAAARAGKHVLCEKPMAVSVADAARLAEVPASACVMEAFMVRFHPQWERARELVREGSIGAPRTVQVFVSYLNEDAQNIRNRVDAGGGALLDIGCYAIVAGRYIFEDEARRAIALIDRDERFGTDRMTSALVDFGAGRQLVFAVATQCIRYQRVQICGTAGRIEIPMPLNAPPDAAMRILLDNGATPDGTSIKAETFPACDQYTLQAEAFARAIRGQMELPYGLADALSNTRVIDALFRSEKSARWENI